MTVTWTCLTVGASNSPHDAGKYNPDVARRVALILDCAVQLYPHRKLGHLCISKCGTYGIGTQIDPTDAFLEGMASASASVCVIDKLTLNGFGLGGDPWRCFARRYGPNVRGLKIDAHDADVTEEVATELSNGLYASGFRSLETLELVSGSKNGCMTRVIQAMLRSVSECPGLQSITCNG